MAASIEYEMYLLGLWLDMHVEKGATQSRSFCNLLKKSIKALALSYNSTGMVCIEENCCSQSEHVVAAEEINPCRIPPPRRIMIENKVVSLTILMRSRILLSELAKMY